MALFKLLTEDRGNPKIFKNQKHVEYLSAILHLAPADTSGYEVCYWRSEGCTASCLNTAGRGKMDYVQNARVRKTKMFFEDRKEFFRILIKDIDTLVRVSAKRGVRPALRLNGTSDIPWERQKIPAGLPHAGQTLLAAYPGVQFYDYTKSLARVMHKRRRANYALILSATEANDADCLKALQAGHNVAVVFRAKTFGQVPATYWGRPVVNGDEHDLRFLDPQGGYVIALLEKGEAKKDETGFVRECGDCTGCPVKKVAKAG